MKLRNRVTTGKIALDMTPMIDVVFQLLIFFMCTLKVIEPEGDFDISMPLGAPSASTVTDAELPPFKVRMEADGAGDLRALYFNGSNLGAGEQAFARLNSEVFRAITALQAIGKEQQEKQEVEIDPDYTLHYRYIINAIGACSGRLGPNGVPVRYISRIKFAPRREP
ncbi:MAG TPA: biopolymer transporter ExbD [Planctomycetaceae bacterium]|jgi:biopolymer transport protein ExbD|nr:biopolymer transporter ExbD [Planctomycetaceae bacterium]HCP11094.1 biopolymer transporter ExbD [Planctomycetaceae bacterium]